MRHVLIVDHDNKISDTLKETLPDNYKVSFFERGEISMEVLINSRPDVLLLATDLEQECLQIQGMLRNYSYLQTIPLIIMTNQEDNNSIQKFLELGVYDIIPKTSTPTMLCHRIKLCLELNDYRIDQSNSEKFQDIISVIFAELVEFRDETTGGHIKNTTKYFEILLKETMHSDQYRGSIPEEDVKELLRSAPLHDIGKIGISDDILRKASTLDYYEYEYMKTHAILGKQAFDRIIRETGGTRWLYLARDLAYYHHERWDGTGYPNGIKGEKIPLYARILAIADVYDALTSRRSYKEAYSHEKAMDLIIEGKGSMFDPYLVDLLVKANERFRQVLLEK